MLVQRIFTHITNQYYTALWQFEEKVLSLPPTVRSTNYRTFIQNEIIKITNHQEAKLYFNANNKPLINDTAYKSISISHTINYLAIQLHKNTCAGIDIETQREKLITIKDKFLSAQEIHLSKKDLYMLCLLWTTKEALFKIHGTDKISLQQHIHITQVKLPYITAKIIFDNKEKEYLLHSHSLYPLIITYVVS